MIPDHEQRGDRVVADGGEFHTEGLDPLRRQGQVVNVGLGRALAEARAALQERFLPRGRAEGEGTDRFKPLVAA